MEKPLKSPGRFHHFLAWENYLLKGHRKIAIAISTHLQEVYQHNKEAFDVFWKRHPELEAGLARFFVRATIRSLSSLVSNTLKPAPMLTTPGYRNAHTGPLEYK